jgi:Mrp family chromosome partitioning ATPase
MRQIVAEAASSFDWVVIDTPPIGLVPDANLLGAMVDTTLLVVQAGSTPYDLVQKAVNSIGRDRIIGVVLNRVEDELRIGYHGKYYRYYERHGHRRA